MKIGMPGGSTIAGAGSGGINQPINDTSVSDATTAGFNSGFDSYNKAQKNKTDNATPIADAGYQKPELGSQFNQQPSYLGDTSLMPTQNKYSLSSNNQFDPSSGMPAMQRRLASYGGNNGSY